MDYDEDNDFISEITYQAPRGEQIDSYQMYILMAGQWGLIIGISWMQYIATLIQGMTLFLGSIITMGFVWMYPGYLAALEVGAREYLNALIAYGSYLVRRQIEIDDVIKVVARMDSAGEITVYDDELYGVDELFKKLEMTMLSDTDVDEVIEKAISKKINVYRDEVKQEAFDDYTKAAGKELKKTEGKGRLGFLKKIKIRGRNK